jgi:acyl carrier protein
VTGDNVETRVREIIAEQLGIGDDEILPDAQFSSDLGADGLDMIELVMALEEEFDVEISDAIAEDLTTLRSVVDYLGAKVQ